MRGMLRLAARLLLLRLAARLLLLRSMRDVLRRAAMQQR
jgi:hypothetical protein